MYLFALIKKSKKNTCYISTLKLYDFHYFFYQLNPDVIKEDTYIYIIRKNVAKTSPKLLTKKLLQNKFWKQQYTTMYKKIMSLKWRW